MESEIQAFLAHHRNPHNVTWHVICSTIYMVFLFHATGQWAWPLLLIYAGLLAIALPHRFMKQVFATILLIAIGLIVLRGTVLLLSLGKGKEKNVINSVYLFVAVAAYFAPSISHYLYVEQPVLNKWTLIGVPINLLFIMPFSLIAQSTL